MVRIVKYIILGFCLASYFTGNTCAQDVNKYDFDKYNIVYDGQHFCYIAVVPNHPYIKCAIDILLQKIMNHKNKYETIYS